MIKILLSIGIMWLSDEILLVCVEHRLAITAEKLPYGSQVAGLPIGTRLKWHQVKKLPAGDSANQVARWILNPSGATARLGVLSITVRRMKLGVDLGAADPKRTLTQHQLRRVTPSVACCFVSPCFLMEYVAHRGWQRTRKLLNDVDKHSCQQ